MSKVIMGNGGFCGCLGEPHGVSAWWKEIAQARVLILLPCCGISPYIINLNHAKPNNAYYPQYQSSLSRS